MAGFPLDVGNETNSAGISLQPWLVQRIFDIRTLQVLTHDLLFFYRTDCLGDPSPVSSKLGLRSASVPGRPKKPPMMVISESLSSFRVLKTVFGGEDLIQDRLWVNSHLLH